MARSANGTTEEAALAQGGSPGLLEGDMPIAGSLQASESLQAVGVDRRAGGDVFPENGDHRHRREVRQHHHPDATRTVVAPLHGNQDRDRATVLQLSAPFDPRLWTTNPGVIDFDLPVPDVPQYFDREFSPAMLVAGEMSRWDYPVKHRTDHDFAVLVLAPGDKRRLWIYGYVHYTDPLTPNEVRKYGWAREYDPVRSQQTKVFKFSACEQVRLQLRRLDEADGQPQLNKARLF